MISIYMMCSKMGPKTYVGSTSDLVKRRRHHKSKPECTSRILVEEYGWDNIIFTVLEECTAERRWECEQYWIDFVPNTVNVKKAFLTEEEYKEYQKAYRKVHYKIYYEANKDARKEYRKVYERTHREKINAQAKARREAKKNKDI